MASSPEIRPGARAAVRASSGARRRRPARPRRHAPAPTPPATPATSRSSAPSDARDAADSRRHGIASPRAAAATAALAALALAAAAAAAAALRPTPITPPSLALSTGGPDAPGGRVWVAFLGDVYDVSTSRRVYGPGGDYAHFAGRDATAAFISGDFGPAGLTPHLLPGALSDPDTLSTLRHWARFYARHPNYTRTGVLVGGPYYDGRGRATAHRRAVDVALRGGARGKGEGGRPSGGGGGGGRPHP